MADVNKSIKADGTGDYTTIIAFEAAITSNAAVGDPWIGTINDSSTYTGALTINVSNTNNAPHKIKAGASFGHGGAFATGGQISVSAGNAVAIATNHITLEGFAISTSVVNAAMIFISGASTESVYLNNLMCRHTATTGSTSYAVYVFSYKASATITINGGCYVTRSAHTAGNGLVFASAAYNVALTNVSALNMGSSAKTIFVGALATLTAINCAAYNNASATNSGFGYTLQSGSDRNCTDDGGGNVGTNPQSTTDGSTFFVSQTSGSEDLHKLATLVNTLLGTNALAASVDIDGQTRIAGKCDIGADMLYPAAPTVDATPAPNATYTVSDSFSVDHAATGTGTLTFDISAGAVPSGTSITGATGVVAGTLTTPELVDYTVRVTDAWAQTGTRQFTSEVVALSGGDGSNGPGHGFDIFKYGFRIGSGRKGLA